MTKQAQKKRKAQSVEPAPYSKRNKTNPRLLKAQPTESIPQLRHESKALTPTKRQPCHFLNLPRELRGIIYEYLFPDTRCIDLGESPRKAYISLPRLRMTCHHLHREILKWWAIKKHLTCVISIPWGLLPLQELTFTLRIDFAFRFRTIENLKFGRFCGRMLEKHRQLKGRLRHAWCKWCWTSGPNCKLLQSVQLRFQEPDLRMQDSWTLATAGGVDNKQALQYASRLPELQRLDVFVEWEISEHTLRLMDDRVEDDGKWAWYWLPGYANEGTYEIRFRRGVVVNVWDLRSSGQETCWHRVKRFYTKP